MAISDRGPELAAVASVFLGLSSLTVCLRCYVRLFVLRLFRLEDWLAVWTLVSSIVYTTFVLMSIQYGAGQHTAAVPLENIPKVLEMRWAGELTYVVTSMSLKLTIGVFLLRICSQTWHRVTIWTVLIVCLAFDLFYVLVAAFQCQPVRYFWERYTNKTLAGTCLSNELITSTTYAAVGINAAADWVLGLLPFALVRNLDLGRRQKISVACILALGSIASTATIVRIFYVCQLTHDDDIVYEFTDLAIWSTVENGLGLTASSIATLRPLFRSFLDVAAQHRISSPWPTLRRASKNLKEHIRGLSVEWDNIHSKNNNRYYQMGHHPPQIPSPTRTRTRYNSGSSGGGSHVDSGFEAGEEMLPTSAGASPKNKYKWQSFDAYESHRDVIAGYYHPVSPRLVRARWHSDGSKYYRRLGGGYEYQYQQSRYQWKNDGHDFSSWSLSSPSSSSSSRGRRSV